MYNSCLKCISKCCQDFYTYTGNLWLPTTALMVLFSHSTVLEFIYAQSPDKTKGLLIGAAYFLIGVWQVITGIFFFVHKANQDTCPAYLTSTMWFFVGIAGISVIGLIVYSPVICLYKNRKRNNPITDILRISMYY